MRSFIFIFSSVVLFQCGHEDSLKLISSRAGKAESVYLTHDHLDNPVVAWTERSGDDLNFFFAVSYDNGKSFSGKVTLPVTRDVATHPEGMPKVAFKRDGTIVAAYEKKAPTESNKYAGAIYYRVSGDAGKTWSGERYLHSDTIAGKSRSYFDIERLPDGEIGASWLDIKLSVETGGRSVRFAKTSGSTSFKNEVVIDSSACQCCRTDVYSDLAGRVNVAYRGLMKGKMGQPVRDMMIATSVDHGKTFPPATRISADNWMIDGCPHTGPSLCSSKGGLYSLWYTEGNGTGIYYSFKQNNDTEFGHRELISNAGRHPQLSAHDTGFIMVWEETPDASGQEFTQIFYQASNGMEVKKECLTPGNTNAFSPVVTQINDGFLVAFLMDTGNSVGLYITGILN